MRVSEMSIKVEEPKAKKAIKKKPAKKSPKKTTKKTTKKESPPQEVIAITDDWKSEKAQLPSIMPTSLQPMDLLQIAVTGDVDIAKLKELMALHQQWQKEEARKAFYFAMSKFQSDMPEIPKNGVANFMSNTGQKVRYTYALLSDISKGIRDLLEPHGLSYQFETDDQGQSVTVSTIVTHRDGHSERVTMTSNVEGTKLMNFLQKKMSTTSYLRRYTLTGALGITAADIDDDGQAAGQDTDSTSNGNSGETPQMKKEKTNYNYYSNNDFEKLFPAWEKLIEEGKKTTKDIFKTLSDKKIKLSPEQIKRLEEVKAK